MMDEVQLEAERVYRKQFGKMVSALLHFSSAMDLETAEDIVQDAFSAALVSWKQNGLPTDSAAWLFKVCRNKALNRIQETKKFSNRSADVKVNPADPRTTSPVLNDQQLVLLFASAHPDISPKVQVVITLKYAINLKVEAIAKILGMSVDGIDKLLVRARHQIRKEKILFEEPSAQALSSRIHIVHKILYLIFNEGYKSSWGKELIREELCEEALLMTRSLSNSKVANKETFALYALMLFNAARFRSRFGPDGELMDLEEQDRKLWNRDLIDLAMASLESSYCETFSTYHCEAAIAAIHSHAQSFKATNWKAIIILYRQLLEINSNPFVELNYAIALFYGGEQEKALIILHRLETQAFFGQYYLLHASLGRIYATNGNATLARQYFSKTLQLTNSPDEKAFIKRQLEKLSGS